MFSTLKVRVQTARQKRTRSARPPPGPGRQLNQAEIVGPGRIRGRRANLRDHDYLVGLRAPVALRDLELDPLTLFEGAVAIDWIAEKCTNTSLPPSTAMKPYPLSGLNHLTVP